MPKSWPNSGKAAKLQLRRTDPGKVFGRTVVAASLAREQTVPR